LIDHAEERVNNPKLPDDLMIQVEEIAQNYSEGTGIPCRIFDPYAQQFIDDSCNMCVSLDLALASKSSESCMRSHAQAAQLSQRYGGSYIYFCHHTLLFWTSPIIREGLLHVSLIAGPVLAVDPQDWLEEQQMYSNTSEKIASLIQDLPCIQTQRVHHLSEMLRMCAAWGSGADSRMWEQSRDQMVQLSRISEHIHQLKSKGDVTPCVNEQEDALQEAIRWGDRHKAQTIMNELLGEIFFTEGETIDRIKYRILELILLLSRAAIQGGAPQEEISDISYRCQREINSYRTMEGMTSWLSTILHQYTDLVFATKNREYGVVIVRALQYIRRNFHHKLTLEDVAHAVALSPNYFSHIFNDALNTSFTSYVNRVRVEYAMRLLATSTMPIVEIAGLSGFEDQSYFTRIFKLTIGITPSQYRKQADQFPSERHEIHEG
jgi:AraC-like DNA-binding protein/ligand-binding sensor protein